MACPDREQLSRHLDGHEPELAAHVRDCRACRDGLAGLERLDDLLRAGSAACPTPTAVLAALGGEVAATSCAPCAEEVAGLREVLQLHERNELPRTSSALRARLKRLAPAGHTTAEELTPAAAPRPSTRSTRRSGTGRLPSGVGRTSTARRRALAFPRRQPSVWGIMAAAAALLFALGLLLRAERPGAVTQTASAPPPRRAPSSPQPPVAPAPRPPEAARPAPAPAPDEAEPVASEPSALPEPAVEPAAEPAEPVTTPESAPPALSSTAPTAPTPEPEQPTIAEAPTPARPPASDDGSRLSITLERLVGAPQLQSEGGTWTALARSGQQELRPGDRLRTGSRGAFLSLEGGSYELCLDADSEIELRAAASGPQLLLERGKVLADVATLTPGRRFTVETPQGQVEVLGTTFGVEARPEGTRLVVLEGTVAASSAAGQAEVSAGFGAAFSRSRAPAAEPADARALGWARDLLPRREPLVAIDFDDRVLGGFDGELSAEGALGGKGLALLLGKITDNRYWGLRARAAEGRIGAFRAGRDVWVQVSLWSEEATDATLVLTNATQKKDFKVGFSLAPRRWKTVHVPLMDLTTYFDPAKNPMREGDLLTGIDVYAGQPGAGHRVLLDGVSVYRKLYRR